MSEEAQILRGGQKPVGVLPIPRLQRVKSKAEPMASAVTRLASPPLAAPTAPGSSAQPPSSSAQVLRELEEALRKKSAEQLKQAIAGAQLRAKQEQTLMLGKLEQQRQSLERLVNSFPEALARSLREAEDEVLALVFELVSQVLGAQALTREGLRSMLAQRLHEWPQTVPMSVHLHPDDLALLQREPSPGQAPPDQSGPDERPRCQWVADPHVMLGGWVLQTSDQTLDARLDVQLTAFKDQLLKIRSSRRKRALAAEVDDDG